VQIVLDTNCVISGLFWLGPARTLLDLGRTNRIKLYSSLSLVTELATVLARPKFAARLKAANVDDASVVAGYASMIYLIKRPQAIRPVCRDPNDDEVLACARAAQADLLVSGDKDLLVLKNYGKIPIVTASQGLAIIIATIGP
jgi:putative PIN family toxin of toxin-antitoxin system